MEDLLPRLRERGWRLTAQRRAVAEVLSGANIHLTADEIHERAQRALPEISRATVYNTLAELIALGEVHEIDRVGRAKRYDANSDAAHQHLVCDRCGRIVDVTPSVDPSGTLGDDERHGFALRAADVTYRGLCPTCAAVTRPPPHSTRNERKTRNERNQ